MSQYNTAPYSAAGTAGWDATDPELVPFLPMMDQSGDWNPPAPVGTGQPSGNSAVRPPQVESTLHAKVEFTGTCTVRGFSSCGACLASFPTNHELEQHAAKDKHKSYLCTCNKGFTKSSALERHIKESTQAAREHKCPLCDHKCKRPGHVQQHLRLVHKKPNDVIKDLLSNQKSKSRQDPQQSSAVFAAAPTIGSMVPQADQPVIIPGGHWTGPIGFSTTAPADHPGSRPGDLSAFYPVLPGPGAGQMAQTPAFGSQSLMMQAMGLPADRAFLAGVAAAQNGFFANLVTDVSGYPAGPLDGNLDFFRVDPASISVNPADGFGMPAPETGSMEDFYDFNLNSFGI